MPTGKKPARRKGQSGSREPSPAPSSTHQTSISSRSSQRRREKRPKNGLEGEPAPAATPHGVANGGRAPSSADGFGGSAAGGVTAPDAAPKGVTRDSCHSVGSGETWDDTLEVESGGSDARGRGMVNPAPPSDDETGEPVVVFSGWPTSAAAPDGGAASVAPPAGMTTPAAAPPGAAIHSNRGQGDTLIPRPVITSTVTITTVRQGGASAQGLPTIVRMTTRESGPQVLPPVCICAETTTVPSSASWAFLNRNSPWATGMELRSGGLLRPRIPQTYQGPRGMIGPSGLTTTYGPYKPAPIGPHWAGMAAATQPEGPLWTDPQWDPVTPAPAAWDFPEAGPSYNRQPSSEREQADNATLGSTCDSNRESRPRKRREPPEWSSTRRAASKTPQVVATGEDGFVAPMPPPPPPAAKTPVSAARQRTRSRGSASYVSGRSEASASVQSTRRGADHPRREERRRLAPRHSPARAAPPLPSRGPSPEPPLIGGMTTRLTGYSPSRASTRYSLTSTQIELLVGRALKARDDQRQGEDHARRHHEVFTAERVVDKRNGTPPPAKPRAASAHEPLLGGSGLQTALKVAGRVSSSDQSTGSRAKRLPSSRPSESEGSSTLSTGQPTTVIRAPSGFPRPRLATAVVGMAPASPSGLLQVATPVLNSPATSVVEITPTPAAVHAPVGQQLAVSSAVSVPKQLTSPLAVVPQVTPAPPSRKVKEKELNKFSGSKDGDVWDVYQAHYELVADFNQWEESTALAHLGTSLTGRAMEYYIGLPREVRKNQEKLMQSMARQFGRVKSLEKARHQLDNMKQKADQTIEGLAQEIRNLGYAVYSKADRATQESECIRSFLKALRDDRLAMQLGAQSELDTLEKVLTKAVALREVAVTLSSSNRNTRDAVVRLVSDLGEEVDDPDVLEQLRSVGMGSRPASGGAQNRPINAARPQQSYGQQGGNHYNRSRNQQQNQQPPRGTCFTCGQPGHWQNGCPWSAWLKDQLQAGIAPTQVPNMVPTEAQQSQPARPPDVVLPPQPASQAPQQQPVRQIAQPQASKKRKRRGKKRTGSAGRETTGSDQASQGSQNGQVAAAEDSAGARNTARQEPQKQRQPAGGDRSRPPRRQDSEPLDGDEASKAQGNCQ